jgi:hypothetical protein
LYDIEVPAEMQLKNGGTPAAQEDAQLVESA